MLKGLNRSVQIFYFISLVFLMLGMGGSAYYYWDEGLMDVNHMSSLYETSSLLDDLNKFEVLAQVAFA